MEGLKRKTLRAELFAAVSLTLLAVLLASAATIWGCRRVQKWLVPDTNYVLLRIKRASPEGEREETTARLELDGAEDLLPYIESETDTGQSRGLLDLRQALFSVESVDYGIGRNGPRRKAAYIGAGIAMGVLPALYSVAGLLLCAVWFYRKKLAPAISVLEEATRHILRQDLNFTVSCGLENELGRLCGSFEQMRQALDENNRTLWKMLEERKLIQASIAHDLRNPIAIIEGYAEYMQLRLQAGDLPPQRALELAGNIANAAKRLERYTESVREIGQLNDIEICPRQVPAGELLAELTADLTVLAADAGKRLRISENALTGPVFLDTSVLSRILENLLNNALRFAREEIELSFTLQDRMLTVTVADEGPGFPEEILSGGSRLLLPPAEEDGHCGMGLTISRLLCQKHGGRLELSNRQPHGAVARIFLAV